MHYLLVGNYGVGNLGDEALKEYFLQAFPEIEWKVLSANPRKGEYPRFPAGFRSLFKPWWRTFGALKKSRGVVFGGGSLFTDVESPFACFLWWWHALVARIFRRPIYFAFQGVGPFKTKIGEWCARWVVRRTSFISVRDKDSYDRIASWRKNTKVVQTIDPVIALIERENIVDESQNVLIAIPRKNSSEVFLKSFKDTVSSKQWDHIRILSLQPDDENERKICKSLNRVYEEAEVISITTLKELVREINKGSLVLTQRYHGALSALVLGKEVEVVEQGAGDKFEGIACLIKEGITKEDLMERVQVGEGALRSALSEGF